MDRINKSFIRVGEWKKGQTTTEYAMVVASVAVAVLSGYLTMGVYLKNLLNGIVYGLL
jgi:Flp pilus assembly pilin Flp